MSAIQEMSRPTSQDRPINHKRTKSSSMLKAMVLPQKHKRNNSEAVQLSGPLLKENANPNQFANSAAMPFLPADHPHSAMNPFEERKQRNDQSPSKKKTQVDDDKRPSALRMKTLSTVSLRDLAKSNKSKESVVSPKKSLDQGDRRVRPKKSKSATNLVGVFSKAKGSKGQAKSDKPPKDQENTTPPGSRDAAPAQTPIWQQFNSQAFFEQKSTTTVPLNDRHSIEEEIALYEPKDYSPSKQRNFFDYTRPTLGRNARPKSEYLPTSQSSGNLMHTLTRKFSNSKRHPSMDGKRSRPQSPQSEDGSSGADLKAAKSAPGLSKSTAPATRRGARVMAAVSLFNSKAKEVVAEAPLDPKQIEAEFEALLESRNIPENMRQKMRALQTRVKADFIRSNKVENSSQSSKEQPNSEKLSSDSSTAPSSAVSELSAEDKKELARNLSAESAKSTTQTKRGRPRSRAFTFSKGDTSPSKKQKGSLEDEEALKPQTTKTATSLSFGKGTGSKASKASAPEEHVAYLRRVTQPAAVETAKLHKLRLLLRNETVSWVDTFIRLGGMTEIVGLLHRIMKVEWRYVLVASCCSIKL